MGTRRQRTTDQGYVDGVPEWLRDSVFTWVWDRLATGSDEWAQPAIPPRELYWAGRMMREKITSEQDLYRALLVAGDAAIDLVQAILEERLSVYDNYVSHMESIEELETILSEANHVWKVVSTAEARLPGRPLHHKAWLERRA